MFRAVVAELQNLGAHLSDALRLANQIDFTQGTCFHEYTAKAFALEAWQEELEGLQRIKEDREWEEDQELLLEALS